MTQPQFYFLMLACGAFVVLGVSLALATVRYWAWKERNAARLAAEAAPARRRP